MSKIRTSSGSLALDNIALIKHISDIDFKQIKSGKRKGSTTAHKSICFVLCSFRNNVTGQCNPSIDRIATCSGCSKDTARRILNDLVEYNVLIKVNSGRVGSNIRNHYYFTHDIAILSDMFEDSDHELYKVSEYDWVELAVNDYKMKCLN